MNLQTRLSLNVKPHRDLDAAIRNGQDLLIKGEIKIAGTFAVAQDFNHGDELTVTIADQDGNVITHGVVAIAGPPPLIPIESKELGLIGYARVHKAQVGQSQAAGARE